MHVHGYLSSDSVLDYRELCNKALQNEYRAIAFTEHFDLVDSEILEYGIISLNKYFSLIDKLRVEFPELQIIRGVELGEPHRVGELSQRLFREQKPDYIIGSLHVTKRRVNVSVKIHKPMSDKEIAGYYEENLEMVEQGGFDTLGHLGIYKRGLVSPQKIPKKTVFFYLDKIFTEIISKNICLEINNSGYKRNFNDLIPETEVLARYRDMGGELITIASDSHDLEQFDKFYKKTLDKIRQIGFRCIWWKNMQIWGKIDI